MNEGAGSVTYLTLQKTNQRGVFLISGSQMPNSNVLGELKSTFLSI